MSRYIAHTKITRELLDRIKVGDLVKVNHWKRALRVKAVSENYFLMATKAFGKTIYSVCEKTRWIGVRHNAMAGSMFHVGQDSWIFGWSGGYDFDNPETAAKYLRSFEDGESKLSPRSTVPIYAIHIKRADT